MAKNIYFIDLTSGLTHLETNGVAIGASEHQFYSLIQELKNNNYNIHVFNKITENKLIDSINYYNYEKIYDMTDIIGKSNLIIQRFKIIDKKFNEIFKDNKKYLWIHDLNHEWVLTANSNQNFINLFRNNKKDFFYNYLSDNIHFIFNSEYTKKLYYDMFNENGIHLNNDRFEIIYNILYENEFKDLVKKESKNNYIVFASAWHKGIDYVINLFRCLCKYDNETRLFLMCPGYMHDRYKDYEKVIKNEFGARVVIFGALKKKDYAKVISGALCVLSGVYSETFGCVFAESYYLGTPVIADIRTGAPKEFIDNNFIINYENPVEFLIKISELKKTRPNIKLDGKFKLEYNINLWKKILD